MMPTPTYVPLATYTVTGSAAASVTFSSISAAYRDLIIVTTLSSAHGFILAEFNGDAGSNYPFVEVYAIGSGSGVSLTSTQTGAFLGYTSSADAHLSIAQVMDYSATDKQKTVLSRPNTPNLVLGMIASRWANTAAIHTVKMKPEVNAFPVGTQFSIFGVN